MNAPISSSTIIAVLGVTETSGCRLSFAVYGAVEAMSSSFLRCTKIKENELQVFVEFFVFANLDEATFLHRGIEKGQKANPILGSTQLLTGTKASTRS